jgi:hypothetical protein
MEDQPKPTNSGEPEYPPIGPEDVDEHGMIIRIRGENRFWADGSENPEIYDYRAGRFLTDREAIHRLTNLEIDNINDKNKQLEE